MTRRAAWSPVDPDATPSGIALQKMALGRAIDEAKAAHSRLERLEHNYQTAVMSEVDARRMSTHHFATSVASAWAHADALAQIVDDYAQQDQGMPQQYTMSEVNERLLAWWHWRAANGGSKVPL